MSATQRYHHGDLRRALLDAAVTLIAEVGPAATSLRELARRTQVSHAAPAHHFGDKTGLLTAVAVQGFDLLTAELRATAEHTGSFVEVGVAYVRFAVSHPAHFATMFRTDLLRADDPDLCAAEARAREVLHTSVARAGVTRPGEDPRVTALAAWSLVHGFASLWSSGSVRDQSTGQHPEELARAVARVLSHRQPES
ncbi:TetR/AcrR family transcriptional regulator [Goodfellowiella coeruleoviolacea]|uniref:Transcriptional regulator, TetR family n=1 Tax=Goodfellowiella coeruleoviolacea TaxID=334858 RepID=A0AAE3GKB2_9PSEU|nr:TetR/AcrR family transcriptional regulator [Goodfellowiella coeruleoviolacea]MCP2169750.1 transcriptional regulator, TetR family [Goodfellowiella coeruleoviolacea]